VRGLRAGGITARSVTIAGVWCVVALVTGCGTSSSKPSSSATSAATSAAKPAAVVRVEDREVPGLGRVLTNGEGRTLYIFEPDARSKVTCTGSCALVWPPLKVPNGYTAIGAGDVMGSLLKTTPNPEGGTVVTYARWPLYLYAGDSGPETAKGQARNLNGGLWYVITPSGQVVRKAP
jgi:predicted lipoprotein with Yx(FWY)xxD motif